MVHHFVSDCSEFLAHQGESGHEQNLLAVNSLNYQVSTLLKYIIAHSCFSLYHYQCFYRKHSCNNNKPNYWDSIHRRWPFVRPASVQYPPKEPFFCGCAKSCCLGNDDRVDLMIPSNPHGLYPKYEGAVLLTLRNSLFHHLALIVEPEAMD